MLRNAIAALILLVAMAAPGLTQTSLAQTALTPAERGYVSRNPLLVSLQREDPRGLRKVLDLLAAHEQAKQAQSRKRRIPLRQESDIDLSGNPDLSELQKSSPEAAHELFQVLKQAGALKPKKN